MYLGIYDGSCLDENGVNHNDLQKPEEICYNTAFQTINRSAIEILLKILYCLFLLQYAGINIGPVHKKDVMKATVMVENSENQ